ncbi:MAG: fumarylacetoacetate hydrolase family protein [Actinomycetota bacterium]
MSTDLRPEHIDEVAERLLEGRRRGVALPPLPEHLVPPSTAMANAVEDLVAERIDRPVLGWKIGCTSEHAKQVLGADGPFAGRIYDLHPDGTALEADAFVTEPHLEGEFAFTMGADLAPVDGGRHRSELVAAIATVHAAIEVVGGRFERFIGAPLNALIADAGANTRLVLGPGTDRWDAESLATTEAAMTVDGERTGHGTGADVLGHPLDALAWLVDHLADRGITLPAGAVVTTGTATQVSTLPPGATATCAIDGIGRVTLHRRP